MGISAPRTASNEGMIASAEAALGDLVIESKDAAGEITLTVRREGIVDACRLLRDTPGLGFHQLMEIAGVDYPDHPERFEVNYHLLSLTHNRRVRVKLRTDEGTSVPTVTGLWPVANWLEREVFDLYGVTFAGHPDLRRILTDYGFEGYPLRKDFPLTGHVEMRYSEAEKRVIYEPVSLAQDFRAFDFMTPWAGPEYRLPGDEKAEPHSPGASSPAPATAEAPKVAAATSVEKREGDKPYKMDNEDRGQAGAGTAAAEARKDDVAKAANAGGRATTQPEPKPDAPNVTRDSGEAQ
jgi:NADH-quinone oxidoreductase subunit C